jgi:DNA invertase Pin-like site-specific DNA recombinase
MDRGARVRTSWRVKLQAAALLAFVTGDGALLWLVGAPDWVPVLYFALGISLASGRVWLARRGRPSAPAPRSFAAASTRAEPADGSALPSPGDERRRAIGYVYVDMDDDEDEDAALQSQSGLIEAGCVTCDLELIRIVHDREAHGTRDSRPTLAWALEQIAAGRADALVTARLRDLSASVANLTPLLRWFDDERRTLIALDLDLNTSTQAGRLAALALAGVGGWERERLSERTRRGLEAERSKGAGQGRAAVTDLPELHARIAAMRRQGMTLQAIADELNADGVPTLRGGAKWRPSSVQSATGYRRPANRGRDIELPAQGG